MICRKCGATINAKDTRCPKCLDEVAHGKSGNGFWDLFDEAEYARLKANTDSNVEKKNSSTKRFLIELIILVLSAICFLFSMGLFINARNAEKKAASLMEKYQMLQHISDSDFVSDSDKKSPVVSSHERPESHAEDPADIIQSQSLKMDADNYYFSSGNSDSRP